MERGFAAVHSSAVSCCHAATMCTFLSKMVVFIFIISAKVCNTAAYRQIMHKMSENHEYNWVHIVYMFLSMEWKLKATVGTIIF